LKRRSDLPAVTGESDRPSGFIAFSPEGQTIAVAGAHGIILLDAQTLETKQVLEDEQKESIISIAFSPDGKFLASSGGEGYKKIRVWKLT
jgi:WD40 repeat protein